MLHEKLPQLRIRSELRSVCVHLHLAMSMGRETVPSSGFFRVSAVFVMGALIHTSWGLGANKHMLVSQQMIIKHFTFDD